MISADNFILLLHAAVGGWLGARSPVKGMALLVALVATTSGLYWHLGFGNLPTVELYLLAMVTGAIANRLAPQADGPEAVSDGRVADTLPAWVALLFLTFGVATAVALVRDVARGAPVAAPSVATMLRQMLEYGTPGVPGQLRDAFVAVIGPALLLLGIRSLRDQADRTLLRRAFLFGLVLAVISPAIQALWFNPWARPDTGQLLATGFSGLFPDPHSFAAFLVLGVGVAWGAALGQLGRGRALVVVVLLIVTFGSCVALVTTNSRSGLAAAVITLLLVLLLGLSSRPCRARWSTISWARVAVVVAVLAATLTAGLLFAPPTVRQAADGGLASFGDMRMWEPLRSDVSMWRLEPMRMRVALWRKSRTLIERRPLWGVGPSGFRQASVPLLDSDGSPIPMGRPENAHNYFLQVTAEYGMPAAAAFVVLVLLVLAVIWRAARQCTDPDEQGMLAGIFAGQVGFLVMSLVSHPMLVAAMQGVYWSLAALGVATAMYSPTCRSRIDPER